MPSGPVQGQPVMLGEEGGREGGFVFLSAVVTIPVCRLGGGEGERREVSACNIQTFRP